MQKVLTHVLWFAVDNDAVPSEPVRPFKLYLTWASMRALWCSFELNSFWMLAWCRAASVEALTQMTCLTLQRDRFVEILGPLEQIMAREKSPQVITLSVLSNPLPLHPNSQARLVIRHPCLVIAQSALHRSSMLQSQASNASLTWSSPTNACNVYPALANSVLPQVAVVRCIMQDPWGTNMILVHSKAAHRHVSHSGFDCILQYNWKHSSRWDRRQPLQFLLQI